MIEQDSPTPEQRARRVELVKQLQLALENDELCGHYRHCGGRHCAVGWAEILWPFEDHRDAYSHAARMLGLPDTQLGYVFDKGWQTSPQDAITAVVQYLEVDIG